MVSMVGPRHTVAKLRSEGNPYLDEHAHLSAMGQGARIREPAGGEGGKGHVIMGTFFLRPASKCPYNSMKSRDWSGFEPD
jgi:hypothetical protein